MIPAPGRAPPRRGVTFNLQWHLSERCNLRCAHCYQDHHGGPEVDSQAAARVVSDFKRLLELRSKSDGAPARGRLTLTGGEPLACRGFFELLESAKSEGLETAVLTNGTLVEQAEAAALARAGVRYVQVSIEGTPSTHDSIRGPGSHAKAVRGLRQLRRAGVRTVISFTAHRGNWREFPEVARLGRSLGVERVWADRLVPLGTGGANELALSREQTLELFESMQASRRRWFRGRTEIAMHRALQFLVGGGRPYRCTAGDTLLTLMPDGTVYPCRRMPIPVGNAYRTSLAELWESQPMLRALRGAQTATGCEGCFYEQLCRGGLRCLSFATTGDPFAADPGCPRAHRSPSQPCLEELRP